MPQALEGIRILDFTDWETGPLATQFMGDFGAEIVKIEQTGKGGWHRAAGPMVGGIGSYWLALNHSKRSLSMDLKAPEARDIVNRLVEGADCVAHNFRPGVMKRLGFTSS